MVGTCGFSYDEWRGPFYPSHLGRESMLDYYADRFQALEIDSTYYRVPGVASARSMVRTARGRLRFLIKAPGAVTHEGRTDADATTPFLRFLEPFVDAEVLAGVLLQFPQSFRPDASGWAHVARLSEVFRESLRVVELRREGWDLAQLESQGWSVAGVDQPRLAGLSSSLLPARPHGGLAVLRFHGRNAAQWHTGDARTRYEYRYSATELQELAGVVRETATKGATTIAFFNNHARGLAVENAATLATMLGAAASPGTTELDLFL